MLKNKRGNVFGISPIPPLPWVLTFVMAAMPPTEGQKMSHKPALTPTMRLILELLTSVHQRLSRTRLVELTGPAFSTVLLSNQFRLISSLRDPGLQLAR
jgi:hypothetical protein